MIIKGKAVTGPQALARYLESKEVNERAEIVEVRGTAATDPEGALIEIDAYAEGTRCQKPLYHVKISPEPPYRLSRDQLNEALELIEQKFGLNGHARVVVIHEKLGREHIHAIWSRIDLENMRAVPLSHNYRKHEEIARELERRFGHPRVQGAHAEREDSPRPERTLSAGEIRQEERTGISAKNVKAEVTAAFRASDSPEAFRAALEDDGYVLAKGDRRDFVIVDRAGGVHSLGRRIEGMKAAELRQFMAPLDREALPTIEQAKATVEDRERGTYSARDFEKWDDALAQSAIEKEKSFDATRRSNAEHGADTDRLLNAAEKYLRKWDDDLAANAIAKAVREDVERDKLRKWKRESRSQANLEEDYAHSDTYANQSEAALKDDKRRQEALKDRATPYHPSEHVPPTVERAYDLAATDLNRGNPGPEEAKQEPEVFRGESRDNSDALIVRAERLYKALDTLLYGDQGHENSEQRNIAEDDARQKRQEREERELHGDRDGKHDPIGDKLGKFDHVEKSEAFYQRIQRMIESPTGDDIENLEPDRQREAPGGGRTRSR